MTSKKENIWRDLESVLRNLTYIAYYEEEPFVEEKVIVEITDGHSSYVIMRMDLVEGILRRQTERIGLREVQIV